MSLALPHLFSVLVDMSFNRSVLKSYVLLLVNFVMDCVNIEFGFSERYISATISSCVSSASVKMQQSSHVIIKC